MREQTRTKAGNAAPQENPDTAVTIRHLQDQLQEKELLLSLNNDIAAIRDKDQLLRIIQPKLKQLFHTEDIFICSLDRQNGTLDPFLRMGSRKRLEYPGYNAFMQTKFPVKDGFIDSILQANDPVVFDIPEVCKWPVPPVYSQISKDAGIRESLSITLRHGDELIGVLTLWSDRKKHFTPHHRALVKHIADQLSVAVVNILSSEALARRDAANRMLLKISDEIAAVRNKEDLTRILSVVLKRYLDYDDSAITVYNQDRNTYSIYAYHLDEKRLSDPRLGMALSYEYPLSDNNLSNSHIPVIIDVEKTYNAGMKQLHFVYQAGIRTCASIKLIDGDQLIGLLLFLSEKKDAFTQDFLTIIQRVSYQTSIAIAKLMANEKISRQLEEINRYKEQLEEEKLYLQEEVSSGVTYSDILGKGEEMKKIFQLLSQVSYTDSTVLLLGETGTGKELVARAIHNTSPRRNKLMVKVNCAAMPANLIESELFGHEKGSFTGATGKRIGKFELANEGTLFLDEIGEMPAELQVKLLRAIQEKEIERIGGKAPIRINVRIIAATNRDLQKEVEEGRFRNDLYYRLNVFPILLPPLRKRQEDIPELAAHFIRKYSKNAGKNISNVSSKAIRELTAYSWPGNVRELEHLIERTVLTTTGETIRDVHLPKNRQELRKALEDEYLKTYEENERDHIVRVLNRCKGKIFGPGGAAEILNLRVSTLNSKIKKLGIRKNKTYN